MKNKKYVRCSTLLGRAAHRPGTRLVLLIGADCFVPTASARPRINSFRVRQSFQRLLKMIESAIGSLSYLKSRHLQAECRSMVPAFGRWRVPQP